VTGLTPRLRSATLEAEIACAARIDDEPGDASTFA
jgi:hypothetical protein